MIEVNLLPNAQKKGVSSFELSKVVELVKSQFQDKYLLATTLSVLVSLSLVAGAYLSQTKRARELYERASVASSDSAQFAKILKARTRAQAARDSVYQQLAIIRSIDNMRYTWAHLLEEVNIALPAYTWLTSITQTSPIRTTAIDDDTASANRTSSQDPKPSELSKSAADRRRARADSLFRGNAIPTQFRIIGQTVDIQALTLFMKNLEASPFIKNVQLARSDLVVSNGKEVTEFQLEAESEVPPESMIQTVPLSIAVK
jgi:Tfp pilus assembly protein PilN